VEEKAMTNEAEALLPPPREHFLNQQEQQQEEQLEESFMAHPERQADLLPTQGHPTSHNEPMCTDISTVAHGVEDAHTIDTATTDSPDDDRPSDPVTAAVSLPSAVARKAEDPPGRTGSATKKPGSNSKPRRDSESIENNKELHEREKESLRAQITTLDERLAKSSNENQLALRHFQKDMDLALQTSKSEAEVLLQQHSEQWKQEHEAELNQTEIPSRSTSHSDEQGFPITKQQLVDPFAVPNLPGISIATLLPNQCISSHQPDTMHEVHDALTTAAAAAAAGGTCIHPPTDTLITAVEIHWGFSPAPGTTRGERIEALE
jgi:hypothetical protein